MKKAMRLIEWNTIFSIRKEIPPGEERQFSHIARTADLLRTLNLKIVGGGGWPGVQNLSGKSNPPSLLLFWSLQIMD